AASRQHRRAEGGRRAVACDRWLRRLTGRPVCTAAGTARLRAARRAADGRMGGVQPRGGRMANSGVAHEDASPALRTALQSGYRDPAGAPPADWRQAVRLPRRAKPRSTDEQQHGQCRAPQARIFERTDDRAWVPEHGIDAAQRAGLASGCDRATARAPGAERDPGGIQLCEASPGAAKDDASVGGLPLPAANVERLESAQRTAGRRASRGVRSSQFDTIGARTPLRKALLKTDKVLAIPACNVFREAARRAVAG